jgi:hypothetical protein
VPTDPDDLIHRLAVADATVIAGMVADARSSEDVTTLVSASLFASEPAELLGRAAVRATSTRDRQVVAIARAHLSGDRELVDALARDHLSDHPTSVLVAWISAHPLPDRTARKDPT